MMVLLTIDIRIVIHKYCYDKTNKYFSGIELKKIGSWISTRSITPDRRPLFGEIKPNFFVSTGLGSSGFTISPFMAFLVAKKDPWYRSIQIKSI